jgi:hypothetical protein
MDTNLKHTMKTQFKKYCNEGKVGWVLLWLLGIPLPVLLLFYLFTGHH